MVQWTLFLLLPVNIHFKYQDPIIIIIIKFLWAHNTLLFFEFTSQLHTIIWSDYNLSKLWWIYSFVHRSVMNHDTYEYVQHNKDLLAREIFKISTNAWANFILYEVCLFIFNFMLSFPSALLTSFFIFCES